MIIFWWVCQLLGPLMDEDVVEVLPGNNSLPIRLHFCVKINTWGVEVACWGGQLSEDF